MQPTEKKIFQLKNPHEQLSYRILQIIIRKICGELPGCQNTLQCIHLHDHTLQSCELSTTWQMGNIPYWKGHPDLFFFWFFPFPFSMMYKHVKQLLSCSSDIMGSPASDTAQKKKKKKTQTFFLPKMQANTLQHSKLKQSIQCTTVSNSNPGYLQGRGV